MTALALVLATALLLGALHAFDPDHLAAATAFVARRPTRRAAVGFALRWGLGHSLTLMAAGLASTLFRLTLTADLERAAELAVGLMLVGVGAWVLSGLARGRLLLSPHDHEGHLHVHLHRPAHAGAERPAAPEHSLFWIGMLHGLAGSAGLLVIVPIGLMASTWAVMAYIVTFSLGVTAAMSAYALVIGDLFGRVAGGAGARWYPWLAGATGAATLLLGLAWISLTIAARAA
jgi:hypothetical protein